MPCTTPMQSLRERGSRLRHLNGSGSGTREKESQRRPWQFAFAFLSPFPISLVASHAVRLAVLLRYRASSEKPSLTRSLVVKISLKYTISKTTYFPP